MCDLKFKGALFNGFSQVGSADTAVYYDLPQYRPFWAEVERLSKVPNCPAKRTLGDYFRNNFHITTSGHFCTPSLLAAMLTIGADRVLFRGRLSLEDHEQGGAWFDAAEIAEADRIKIGRTNATALFDLG